MSKPTESILGRDESQSLGNRLLEVFACTGTNPSQKGFQFGESLLNRRKIRRIGGQKHETTPFGFDGLFDPASQMNTEIIQDHDLSGTQAGSKDLLDVDLKDSAISSPIQDERFSHPLHRQGSQQRHVGPIIAWNLADGSLSSGSVGIQRRHGNMGAGLIEKHQILTEEMTSLLTPGRASSFVLFPSYQGLFFRVQPRTALARLMLAGLTRRPWLAANNWQCSSRVASGWVSNCALKFACNAAPILAGRPGIALGKT